MRALRHPHLTSSRGRGMDHNHRGRWVRASRVRAAWGILRNRPVRTRFGVESGFPSENATKKAGEVEWFPAPTKRKPLCRCVRVARTSETMLPDLPSRQEFLQVAETLLIAAAGGVAFSLIGVPAGLVSGSVLAVASAALARRPTKVPLWLARMCFVLIGMLLGAVVTPETLAGITTWPLSVAILAVSTICTMVATTCYLRFAHGWDPLSALLG